MIIIGALFHVCSAFVKNVRDIYVFTMRKGFLELPKLFYAKVSEWFDHKKELMDEVKNQVIQFSVIFTFRLNI